MKNLFQMLFSALLLVVARLTHGLACTPLANAAGAHPAGVLTYRYEETVSDRYLVAKQGTAVDQVGICDLDGSRPIGIMTDEADAANDRGAVQLFSAPGTRLGVAAKVIAFGDALYVAANGQITDTKTVTVLNWKIGRALQAAAAQGDEFEFDPCVPVIAPVQLTMGGGAATEAETVTGLLTTDRVVASVIDNAGNDDLQLLEVLVAADTITFRFNEDPTAGVTIDVHIVRD